MTAALTSAGVQQVSITIANGSLTGTGTITAVGSGAFILYQGINPTDSANADDTNAYVTKTNSTTLTATRGVTGSSKSVIINAVIIDGDTTNLIKSVQYGTVTTVAISSGGTATISAVTNANTALAYLGQSDNASVTSYAQTKLNISLSGTTVTCARSSFSGSEQGTAGFCVIEFQGSALNSSTQQKSIIVNSGTSLNTTISSVTTANSFLVFGGFLTGNGVNPNKGFDYAQLTSSTNVSLTCNTSTTGASNTYVITVVELVSGLIAQTTQRGTIALSAAASNTATITSAATASSFANWLHNSTSASTYAANVAHYNLTQTNATTLTMTAQSAATGTGSYEVITLQPYASSAPGGTNLWFSMDGL